MIDVNSINLGDCLEVMKDIDDNTVDAIVTDPPYGISFMGKKWDYDVPSVEIWEECLRILKPGGYLLSFAGTRTYHRMACAIEDGGFEIRDMIEWIYGSGFPKSLNIGDGWGTALKPAHEPICMARKPLSEKTVIDNVLKWATGGINIDDSRIALNNEKPPTGSGGAVRHSDTDHKWGFVGNGGNETSSLGRFPANLIHDGSDEVVELFPNSGSGNNKEPYCYAGVEYDNKDTSMFNGDKPEAPSNYNDKGSAARFFYCAKASKSERNAGCGDLEEVVAKRTQSGGDDTRGRPIPKNRNSHPTVKPISLMEYLVKLVSREEAVVLDPFGGSGSTGVACVNLNRNFVLIEKEEEYFDIAVARVNDAVSKLEQ